MTLPATKFIPARSLAKLAQFDEALEFLVENYPQKDYILKASGNNGGGSRPTQHDIGQKTIETLCF
ncbi:Uncharacterised protein [Escherichia coli]|uniref:DUF6651 domain-containing protein n=1 Tax=Escherichia coli TaxID=562 RepID=A0A377K6X7_ECOLX|nr:Uncharacterised protein [Escherichia coli]